MEQLLRQYLRRLTNLTGNNRSILLRKLLADQFIDLHDMDFLHDQQTAFQLIEQLIARTSAITLGPVADSRHSAANVVSRKLKKLQRINRFIYDERGSKDLYVGWPFVRGQLADGTLIRCPLLFFPVDIVEEDRQWKMQLRQDVSISLNKSFLLAYAHFNETSISEELFSLTFDDWETDSREFRTQLYKLFRDQPPEINFNQEIFIDKLIPFQEYSRTQLEEETKSGELKLYPEAVIGIFPQAGSYFVPDYNHLLRQEKIQSIEDLFVSRIQREEREQLSGPAASPAAQHEELSNIREETIFAPFPMDASQEAAIRAIKAGRSLVVQGPPGTGKSQLIANVMADAMAKGKRVLLVSQKKAALDVVHKRLDQKQIVDFVALVHDFKWDRKKIFEQIARQADRVPEYKDRNYGLDTIQLERKFLQTSRRIEQIKEELREFKHALFDDTECGLPVKDLYLSSDKKGPVVDLRQEYKDYPFAATEDFIRKLKTSRRLAARLNQPNYPWRERLSFGSYGVADQQKIQDVILEVQPFQEQLSKQLQDLLQSEVSFETAVYLLNRRKQSDELLELLQDPAVYECFRHMVGFKQSAIDGEWLAGMERSLLQCFVGEGPELSLNTGDLGDFQEILQRRIAARRSILRWASWRYLGKEEQKVRRVLVTNKLKGSSREMAILEQKIDNRLNLEHNLTQLKETPWLWQVPETYQKLDFQQWFAIQKNAIAALELFYQIRGYGHYFNVRKISYKELKEKIEALYILLAQVPEARERWLQYLSPMQLEQLLQTEGYAEQLMNSLEEDFDFIAEFDRMQESLSEEERSLIRKLISAPGAAGEEQVVALFANSLKIAWINHIEAKYPVLRSVSTQSLQQLEEELRQCIEEKASVSQEMLLMKVREQTYQELEYNRLNNVVTYRDLRHQAGKKRKIWPLRRLIQNFGEELLRLVPCWMASPEAVSAIFPMEELFDLVIFDEASQCYVEKGLPAMYRGRQVLITGDSKQLQPSDIYQVRWEEEDAEESVDLEIDSLLDLADRHLMQIKLKGHYRSMAPELIDFSNRHFYENTLQMVPQREIVNKKKAAIRFQKVEGVWEDQMNKPEAEEVVQLVMQLIKKEKDKYFQSGQEGKAWYEPKSIGVLTFNLRQQNLIQDLLEEKALQENLLLPEDLFVKNIENVQGDERDIIVFSVGYAPDKEGRMSMHFGSLNMAQGENRLNVAVTRARHRIYVVSSIWPGELKTENSKNAGPHLFKKYLEYALEVSEGKYLPVPNQPAAKGFGLYLKDYLKEMPEDPAYLLEERQPFADLTALKDGKYGGVVFTDDAQYFAQPSLKEIHVYRKQELEEKHWRHLFVYSREYWQDPVGLREKLNRFMHHL
ncbi:AAA domain-containing protein [Nafulsella turpanensis]|uniref:AAA domain-containing protein n=1 Tax=Nafulsella turpanensis TaxID=1265690 RepID=UPI00034BBEF1|nr:AAA domain-containing protein [Nafulsella turpanensis]